MSLHVAVYIGNFIHTPASRVGRAVEHALTTSLEHCDVHVTIGNGEIGPENSRNDMDCFMRSIAEQTEKTMQARSENSLAASIVPLQLEVRSPVYGVLNLPMLFVSARNEKGHEWIYAHVVGGQIAPHELVEKMAYASGRVLEERGTITVNPPEEELTRATQFIELLAQGAVRAMKPIQGMNS